VVGGGTGRGHGRILRQHPAAHTVARSCDETIEGHRHVKTDRRVHAYCTSFFPFVLTVLRLERGRVIEIAAFEQPSMFTAFGLPASL
jgi:hypothetical protein